MTGVALASLAGLASCQRQQESAFKPIDKAALQTMGDAEWGQIRVALI